MSLADYIPAEFIPMFTHPDFSKAIKGYNMYLLKEDAEYNAEFKLKSLNLIKEDPEYRAEVKTYFDECIVTSELKPIKRLAAVETVTGLNDYSDFEDDEEREPNIPEQIDLLSERIENLELNRPSYVTPPDPKNIFPETKTEARAVFLVEYLNKEVKERNGEFFLNGSEIKEFLTKIIPDRYNPDFTVKKDQNIRKLKKDVITKAKQLFPNNLFVNKNKNGRHETRILFKPSPTVT
jgi:hypothetical protein